MSQDQKKSAHLWPQTAMRFSDLARDILKKLAERDGCSRTAVVERLLRDENRRKRVVEPQ